MGRAHPRGRISGLKGVTRERAEPAFSVSEVSFAPMSDADIQAYLGSGEWQGKAGGWR